VNNVSVDKIIEIGVQAGVKEALIQIRRDKEEQIKFKSDRRLRNTDLLLRSYNNLQKHYASAVYTTEQIKEQDVDDFVQELDELDGELYINAIKRTHIRTKIMLEHVNKVLRYYKYSCNSSGDESVSRRYEVVSMFYIKRKTYDQICEELHCSSKTVGRDKRKALEDVSVLLFGIDGLKFSLT